MEFWTRSRFLFCSFPVYIKHGNESAMAAQKSTQQQYEYLLFGSVPESNVQSLLHRLRGLCDFATTGGLPFTDREIAYRIGEWVGMGVADCGISCCRSPLSLFRRKHWRNESESSAITRGPRCTLVNPCQT